MKLRDKKTKVVIEVNREAFVERGQDFDGFIEMMKEKGFEELELE